jgi:2-dehydro-3-deoxy-L-rhamnonate dehydrogenase (NAD+)
VTLSETAVRTAIVTGASSGIGAACVRRLRSSGIRVVGLDLRPPAEETLDVTDGDAVARLADELGPVDIVINSAGIVGSDAAFLEAPIEAWRSTFEVNVLGAVNIMRAFVPGMVERGWGRVVNIASVAGKEGTPRLAPYSASKGALLAATKSIGKELAATGVLVNAIAPGTIETAMSAATSPEVIAHTTSLIPMRRIGRAEEVAELAAWLASDAVSFSTGAVYDISGGRATY